MSVRYEWFMHCLPWSAVSSRHVEALDLPPRSDGIVLRSQGNFSPWKYLVNREQTTLSLRGLYLAWTFAYQRTYEST